MAIDESNWLDSKVVECLQCGQKLHWLWHSPFYDEIFFYCDQCPKRVEVSSYDELVRKLHKIATEEAGADDGKRRSEFYSLIEEKLADCECGGRFKYDAPRRCLRCFSVLAQSELGRDVWPPESADEKFSLGYESLSSPGESLIKIREHLASVNSLSFALNCEIGVPIDVSLSWPLRYAKIV